MLYEGVIKARLPRRRRDNPRAEAHHASWLFVEVRERAERPDDGGSRGRPTIVIKSNLIDSICVE